MTKQDEELASAIASIQALCPTEWQKIGKVLREQAIPREGGDYASLSYIYIQKATVVGIMDMFGFEF